MAEIIDRSHFDLANRFRREPELLPKLSEHLLRLGDLKINQMRPGEYQEREQRLMAGIWRDCGMNMSLLVPYFFPKYPKKGPMSMFDRPFNMILMFLLPYFAWVLRGSRQTGKSVSLGSRQRTHAHMFPGFRSLYVAPHSEPLNTYCRKFLDIERAFKFPAPAGDKFKQNLQYKEFPNGAKVEMVRVQTSATPVRGKTYDEICWDETVRANTSILVLRGETTHKVKIVDMLVGMDTVSFDDQQHIERDRVRAVICRGNRHTWKLHCSRGAVIECTGSTRLFTTGGWASTCELLSWEEAARCEKTLRTKTVIEAASAIDPGHATWRREHGFFAAAQAVLASGIGKIQNNPRGGSGGVLPGEGGEVGGLHQHASAGSGERGIRGQELRILYPANPLFGVHQGLVLRGEPGSAGEVEEDSDGRVGGLLGLGRGGLVVPGRRLPTGEELHVQHAQLQQRGGRTALPVVHPQGHPGRTTGDQEEGQALLAAGHPDGECGGVQEEGPAIHAPDDALQGGFAPARPLHVYILRQGVRIPTRADEPGEAVLRGPGVPEETEQLASASVCGEGRCEAALPTPPGQTGSRPGEEEKGSGQGERKPSTSVFRPGIPGQVERVEEGVPAQEEGRGEAGKDGENPHLPVLQSGVYQHKGAPNQPWLPDHLLLVTRLPGKEESGDAAYPPGPAEGEAPSDSRMIPDEVVWIEYVGEQEVWDIETEKNHTFFANGIAVHNCQIFDPGLETEVLEVLNDSDIKSVLYAGTSTSTETLLEARYQEGTQAVWHIPLDNGQTINCGDAEQVMRYIGPYRMEDPHTGHRIDPLRGFYVYENPAGFERRMISIHIPQIINPDKANDPLEWNGIYKTMIRDPKKFIQEKLGIPLAEANQEVSEADLKRICVLEDGPEARKAKCRSGYYRMIVSGFDWGGSDYNPMTRSKISSTVHSIIGVSPDDRVHILHVRRHAGKAYKTIMDDIVKDHHTFCAGGMASDFGGGQQYHELLRSHPMLDATRHVIFDYSAPETALCAPSKTSTLENMLMLNRTESITALYMAIVMDDPLLLSPGWLEMEEYLRDFLNMNRVLIDKERGHKGRRFAYHRHPSKTDDVVHSLNFAYSLLRLSNQQLLIEDPAARRMIRDAVYGGQGRTVKSLNPFSKALSNYARGAEDHD